MGELRESSSWKKMFKNILEMGWGNRGEDDDVELNERKGFYPHYLQKPHIFIKKPKPKHKKPQNPNPKYCLLAPVRKGLPVSYSILYRYLKVFNLLREGLSKNFTTFHFMK